MTVAGHTAPTAPQPRPAPAVETVWHGGTRYTVHGGQPGVYVRHRNTYWPAQVLRGGWLYVELNAPQEAPFATPLTALQMTLRRMECGFL